jgi:hypothetical protein
MRPFFQKEGLTARVPLRIKKQMHFVTCIVRPALSVVSVLWPLLDVLIDVDFLQLR